MSQKILLAIAGGVAAYKSAVLCSRLVQAGRDVRVVLTASGEQFIGGSTLAALSGKRVITQVFDPAFPAGAHIELVEGIDLMLIAPATAHVMANLAGGNAGDLLSTCYLQNTAPVLLAPAMSDPMWSKPSVQRNVQRLRDDGCHFIGPESGWLACRKVGRGRMSEPETIVDAVDKLLPPTTT